MKNKNIKRQKVIAPTCKEQQHQCTKNNTNAKKEATSHKTSENTMQNKQQHQHEKTTPYKMITTPHKKKHQQQKKNNSTNMKKLTISRIKSGNYYLENCNLAQGLTNQM
jgi:hypothetical protein